jgi:hypothetical protein
VPAAKWWWPEVPSGATLSSDQRIRGMRRRLTIAAVLFGGALAWPRVVLPRAPDATEQDYVCQAKAAEASMHAGVKRTTTHADLGLRQRFAGQ